MRHVMSSLILMYCRSPFTVLVFGVTALCFTQPAPEPLAWDSLVKQQTLPPGGTAAHFTFSVTNVSAGEVVVQKVSASCGCTAVQLPATPWRLAPGTHGDLKFTMDLRGKRGTITKTATVQTSAGIKVLTLSAIIPEPVATALPGGAPSIARQVVAVPEASRAMPGALSPGRDAFPRVREAQPLSPATQGRAGSPLPAAPPDGAHGVTRPHAFKWDSRSSSLRIERQPHTQPSPRPGRSPGRLPGHDQGARQTLLGMVALRAVSRFSCPHTDV